MTASTTANIIYVLACIAPRARFDVSRSSPLLLWLLLHCSNDVVVDEDMKITDSRRCGRNWLEIHHKLVGSPRIYYPREESLLAGDVRKP